MRGPFALVDPKTSVTSGNALSRWRPSKRPLRLHQRPAGAPVTYVTDPRNRNAMASPPIVRKAGCSRHRLPVSQRVSVRRSEPCIFGGRMPSSLRFQSVAARFQAYINELHGLFPDQNATVGSPERLLLFAREVFAPGPMQDEIRSILRNAILRESREISHGELVEMLLVAAGGTGINEEIPEVQQAERLLSRFVGQVMTTPDPIVSGEAELTVEGPAASQPVRWAKPPTYLWIAAPCAFFLPLLISRISSPSAAVSSTALAHARSLPAASTKLSSGDDQSRVADVRLSARTALANSGT